MWLPKRVTVNNRFYCIIILLFPHIKLWTIQTKLQTFSLESSLDSLEGIVVVFRLVLVVGFVVAVSLYDDVGRRSDGDSWREVSRRGVWILQDAWWALHNLHL